MSGHGSQIPARPGDEMEPDGLDEIFLPSDFRIGQDASDGTVTIQNHIVDNEIGDAVERLLKRDVFVWLVVDACHSGTLERSVAPAGQARVVTTLLEGTKRVIDLNLTEEGQETEVTPATLVEDAASPVSVSMPSASESGFVGFYAAVASELAMEYPLPKGATAEESRVHGLMTWTLIQALRAGEAATYEDLARTVTREFWQWGNGAPRPMFVGNLGDAPMLEARGDRGWNVSIRNRTLYIAAGRLDSIEDGAVFSVFQGLQNEPLFFARVTQSALEEARLEIITDNPDRPDRIATALRREGFPTEARYRWRWLEDRAPSLEAKVVSRPIPFVLRVARPMLPEGSIGKAQARLAEEMLLKIADASDEDRPVALEVLDAAEPADIRLVVRRDRVWFVPELGAVITEGPRQAYSLPIEGLDAEILGAALRQIGRARNLLKLAEVFAGSETARQVGLRLAIEERSSDPATGTCAPHPSEEPARAPAASKVVSDFGQLPSAPIRVSHCDRVYLVLRNEGDAHLDVSPFYFSPHSEVYYLRGYRDAVFFGLRLRPGETRVVSYTENTASSAGSVTPVGLMRLVLIAVEARSVEDPAMDFRHLEGDLPKMRQGPQSGLADMLASASFGDGTMRSAQTGRDTGRSGSLIIPLETFAPKED